MTKLQLFINIRYISVLARAGALMYLIKLYFINPIRTKSCKRKHRSNHNIKILITYFNKFNTCTLVHNEL